MTNPDWLVRPQDLIDPPLPRPTTRTWLKHIALLGVTFCTATIAGSIFPFGPYQTLPEADPQNLTEALRLLFLLPMHYGALVAGALQAMFLEPGYLAYGLKFSASLLFILTCHEMGHYVACRLYKVDASLPFFIPLPPMIGPAGTFGAFIKIKSPLPSHRATFDIGVAGPIAGFLALLPIAAIGVMTMEAAPPELAAVPGGLVFSDPLLMRLLGWVFGVDPSAGIGNPFYFAAWVGLLVTAFNLLPSGQLDGGHAIYAVFGERVHRMTGQIAFAVIATLSIVGLAFYGSPSGLLVTIVLAVMMRVKHPEPWDQAPLDAKRKLLAFATLIIFVLSFVPFPIRIS